MSDELDNLDEIASLIKGDWRDDRNLSKERLEALKRSNRRANLKSRLFNARRRNSNYSCASERSYL